MAAKGDFNVFELRNWKDRIANYQMGETLWEKGKEYQELSFGHIKFEMLIRHPNGYQINWTSMSGFGNRSRLLKINT